MNKLFKATGNIIKLLLLFLAFFIFTASAVRAAEVKTVKILGWDYPPFWSHKNKKISGIAYDVCTELFNRMNIKQEYTFVPLNRAYKYIEHGTYDIFIPWVKNPEREQIAIFSDGIIAVPGYIWSNADRKGGPIEFDFFEDFKKYKIGVTLGYSYGPRFDEYMKTRNDVSKAPTDLMNFKMLLKKNRIDLFPCGYYMALALFKDHPELQGKFVHSKNTFANAAYHFAISKKSKLVPLIPEINKAIEQMKSDGTIDRIVKKYIE